MTDATTEPRLTHDWPTGPVDDPIGQLPAAIDFVNAVRSYRDELVPGHTGYLAVNASVAYLSIWGEFTHASACDDTESDNKATRSLQAGDAYMHHTERARADLTDRFGEAVMTAWSELADHDASDDPWPSIAHTVALLRAMDELL